MKKLTFARHPLHVILNDFPLALMPTSSFFDSLHWITGNPKYRDTATHNLTSAYILGLLAAGAGLSDYLAIPDSQPHVRRHATSHMILSFSSLALMGTSLLLRKRNTKSATAASFLFSMLATSNLAVSGWVGGALVYSHGMRVKGISPISGTHDTSLPGSRVIERGMAKLEDAFSYDSQNH